jgi:hypothetical protein
MPATNAINQACSEHTLQQVAGGGWRLAETLLGLSKGEVHPAIGD